MSFQPLVGAGGYAGWRLLSRTVEAQKAVIARDPAVARDSQHVRTEIGKLESAEQLVSDFRLLRTTLSAFGLEADVNKKAFIRKVLDSDPADPKSFANRLSDKRYRALAEAMQFGSRNGRPAGLGDRIVERHVAAELERRVGTVDGNLRLALNAQRELVGLGNSGTSENARWYAVLGSLPLRKVVEGALGLGSSFGKMPIDRQMEELKSRAERQLGIKAPSDFADPAVVEKVVQRFLLRADAVTQPQSSYNIALALLS